MTKRSGYMHVRLTVPQAEAIDHALAYCTSGSPADIGMEDNAEGERVIRNMERAHAVLAEAFEWRSTR